MRARRRSNDGRHRLAKAQQSNEADGLSIAGSSAASVSRSVQVEDSGVLARLAPVRLQEGAMPQVRANGIDIEYESFGREGDPLILLIMGFGAQLIFWPEALCQGLAAKGFRVVRFDNRDIGKSTHLAGQPAPDPRALMAEVMAGRRPHVPYSLDDMADDAVGLMDALGVERAHIVGASMGGMIAQLVAINHPGQGEEPHLDHVHHRTAGSAVGEPRNAVGAVPPAEEHEPRRSHRREHSRPKGAVRSGLSSKRSGDARERRAPHGLRAIRHGRPRAPVGGFDRRRASQRALESRCAVPTLVLHGADDPVIPAAAGKDTAESIPGAELVIVPGMGHDFPPALVPVYLKHIGDFVSKVEAETSAAR